MNESHKDVKEILFNVNGAIYVLKGHILSYHAKVIVKLQELSQLEVT